MRAQDVLPDHINSGEFNGVTVRKGTVGAFLANARTLQAKDSSEEARAEARADIIDGLPGMEALGVFDIFEISDPALRELVAQHRPA
ncbi:hypothetical protein D0T25_03560 [Duganella sp. BJB488]|uniref:hypothetical protein n=1 Tax=unclassified Duganella TaxID=2636909 RepID=UPI000E355D4B|nr:MULTISPECIES: hypothetical protein [unclassified Duganella]RFP24122.1 hypothetical protein D0T26_03605 [Duganella sp. BJB489]RFP26483.1 hypothetical protein D0T25_03560 [Duganella sp. BJB488]RFP34785.1 hypothetical protein D0T24_14465 [Duganella sp. BJB480]